MDIEEAFLAERIQEHGVSLSDQEETDLQEVVEHLMNEIIDEGAIRPDGALSLMMLSFVAGRAYEAERRGDGEVEFSFPLNLSKDALSAFIEFLAERAQL